jgi:hypothetical protein
MNAAAASAATVVMRISESATLLTINTGFHAMALHFPRQTPEC